MFNVSIAGCNTGGGNVNFKGFANHVYRLPHRQYGSYSPSAARYSLIRQQLLHIQNSREGSPHNALHLPSDNSSPATIGETVYVISVSSVGVRHTPWLTKAFRVIEDSKLGVETGNGAIVSITAARDHNVRIRASYPHSGHV